MASTKTPPGAEPQDQAPDAPAERAPVPKAAARAGEYLDETPRTYFWPDGPQSVELGDVVLVPAGFDDGRFGPTSKKPTRLRDNHPDQREVTAERQSKARAEVHRRIADEEPAARGEGE